MKKIFIIFLGLFFVKGKVLNASPVAYKVSGKLMAASSCPGKVMVWLSLDKEEYKERSLLMHTVVPPKGSFDFYLRPGNYLLKASNDTGCEFSEKLSLKNKNLHMKLRLAKK